MIKSVRIFLPQNPSAKARLEKKLNEYERRVAQMKQVCPYDNPDISYNSFNGYKALLARRLCLRGEVQSRELAEELKEEFGSLDTDSYNNAVRVISDYCRTGGKNVRNGTGF
jgi:hypothetical protein